MLMLVMQHIRTAVLGLDACTFRSLPSLIERWTS
jgi:hypothetical protein